MSDLLHARQFLERGALDQAEAAYQRLVADPTSRSEALYGLGLIAFRRRDYSAAANMFGKSLEVHPGGQNPLYFLGEIANIQGERNEAIRLYASVLTQNPSHVGALRRIASFVDRRPVGPRPADRGGYQAPAPRVANGSPEDASPPATQGSLRVGPPVAATGSPVLASAPVQFSPPAPAVLKPPRPPSSKRSIVGIAEHVKLQVIPFNGQAASRQLLTLRLRVVDEHGKTDRSVGIEMRGFKIRGNVENGDWVEVRGGSERSGKVRSFRNLTTDVVVSSGLF